MTPNETKMKGIYNSSQIEMRKKSNIVIVNDPPVINNNSIEQPLQSFDSVNTESIMGHLKNFEDLYEFSHREI